MVNESSPKEVRKCVTVAFCDLLNSTRLAEQLDAEPVHRLIGRYFEEMTKAAKHHGASIDYSGDAIVAVFGLDELHEDDALRAVRAAAEMREALATLNQELHERWNVTLDVRIGLNTGEIVAGDQSREVRMVVADAFNVAARLEEAAGAGEVLLADTTYRLVRDGVQVTPVEPLLLKGKSSPVRAFKLVRVIDPTPGLVRRLDAPIVGREAELQTLVEALERSARAQRCVLVTVVGDAGIGKSRLMRELMARAAPEARVLRGRCLPYGKGITFWPIAEIVKDVASVNDGDSAEGAITKIARLMHDEPDAELMAERVSGAIGVSEAAADREGIFLAIKGLISALARDQPLVIAFDDVHWAEPTLIELVLHLTREVTGPVLLLAASRPEHAQGSAHWRELEKAGQVVRLDPLQPEQSRALLERILGGLSGLRERALDQIMRAAQGNPLFLEEILRMLIDDGDLRAEGDGWLAAQTLGDLDVPPTIQALLAARLERLDDDQRLVLERGAVIGEEFYASAVEQLLDEPLAGGVAPVLDALAEKGLVARGGTPFAGEPALRFRHLIQRDVVYAEMLKEVRLELHEHVADWLERTAGERAGEFNEILGYHLEQAARYRAEIWPRDPRSVELGRRASARLAAAGRRALALGDMPAAANLLERAMELVGDDAARHDLLPKLAFAFAETGNQARADELFNDWVEDARRGRSLLVYRRGDGHEEVFDLDAAPARVTLGRRSSSDIPLDWDREASRLHAVLERTGSAWTLSDDGLSRNGSYVNGELVSGQRTLRDGDLVRLGATTLVFRSPEARLPGPGARTRDTTADLVGLFDRGGLAERERWLLAALCRPLLASGSDAKPASDEEIAKELEIPISEVEQGLDALYGRFDTEAGGDPERRARLAQRAIRSGGLEYPGLR